MPTFIITPDIVEARIVINMSSRSIRVRDQQPNTSTSVDVRQQCHCVGECDPAVATPLMGQIDGKPGQPPTGFVAWIRMYHHEANQACAVLYANHAMGKTTPDL
jgi:hypothetical protein